MGQFVGCQLDCTTHLPESNVGSRWQRNGRIAGGPYISVVAVGILLHVNWASSQNTICFTSHWCSEMHCQKLLEPFNSWVEELAHVGNGMDADLPDVKSAILTFKVYAFYRHFGKYFLFVCIGLFAVQTLTDVCNFRLIQFLEKLKKKSFSLG
jgi:hypothetical protein